MKLQINPNSIQLEEIKQWLIEENKSSKQGFFCNWNIIENSFKEKRFWIYQVEGKVIGFISWTEYDSYLGIDIMEIHPTYRNRGIGRAFYEKAEDFFRFKDFKAIELFCAPEESEKFWKRMNFIKFPNIGYSEPELKYYKPLIDINTSIKEETLNKLELWDLEPNQRKDHKPRWTWEIKENQNPIIQPCNPNWNLRLTINGEKIKEDKVKYFSQDQEIQIGPFLFLETLDFDFQPKS